MMTKPLKLIEQSYIRYTLPDPTQVGVPLGAKPSRLWTMTLQGDPSEVVAPVHSKNARLEECGQTWSWEEGTLRYCSSAGEPSWLLLETPMMVQYQHVSTLHYYDEPLISIVKLDGALYLEVWEDHFEDVGSRYALSPITDADQKKLEAAIAASLDEDISICREIQMRGAALQLSWGTKLDPQARLIRLESLQEKHLVGAAPS